MLPVLSVPRAPFHTITEANGIILLFIICTMLLLLRGLYIGYLPLAAGQLEEHLRAIIGNFSYLPEQLESLAQPELTDPLVRKAQLVFKARTVSLVSLVLLGPMVQQVLREFKALQAPLARQVFKVLLVPLA